MKTPFLQVLQERVLLGDGALGTYIYEKGVEFGRNTDVLNVSDPDLVFSIHEEYVRAGSDLIETNTFGANRFKLHGIGQADRVREINLAGAALAARAAGRDIYVAGSIGPTGADFPLDSGETAAEEIEAAFSEQAAALLEGGVDLLMLETFTHLDELLLALRAARRVSADVPLVAQMVFPSQGRTAPGVDALLCAEKALDAGAGVFGSNCGRGVKATMEAIERLSGLRKQVPLSAFPNAGLPEVVGHRTVYPAHPAYMAQGLAEMIRLGARLVGGCCGTTPGHIHEFRNRLHLRRSHSAPGAAMPEPARTETAGIAGQAAVLGGMLDSLRDGRLPILVELDPPPHLEVEGVVEGAGALAEAGADAITLAENPLAVLRSDNLSLAHLIRERIGVHTVLHLTCRDRNVLGLQAQIMGAHILGIEAILAITGDPASSSDQPGTSGVFDINSMGLVRMIDQYNRGFNLAGRSMKRRTNFSVGVAFSYRPANPELQIRRLEKKAALGAHFVMTQPLFDAGEMEAMMESIGHLDLVVFPGVFPLISARNADFLHNEVPGIHIPRRIRETLWKYEQVEDQRKAAMNMTRELIASVAPWVDGLYIISPLNKWDVSRRLVEEVRKAGWMGSGRAARAAKIPES